MTYSYFYAIINIEVMIKVITLLLTMIMVFIVMMILFTVVSATGMIFCAMFAIFPVWVWILVAFLFALAIIFYEGDDDE